jgi:hypothetical protein
MPMLDRRQLLKGLVAGAGVSVMPLPALATQGPPKRLLVIMCEGGWDVSYCLDPKLGIEGVDGPESDQDPGIATDIEAIQTFSGIPVLVNPYKRPSVARFFDKYASEVAVVNGIWVGAIAHATARVRILNGTALERDPSWAAIAGAVHGVDLPLGSIDLSGGSYMGPLAASAGQIGIQSQLKALIDPASDFPPPDGLLNRPGYRLDDADQAAMFQHLLARNATVADAAVQANDVALLADRHEALTRASRFRLDGREAVESLTLGTRPSFSKQLELAMDLLGGDLCRAVTVDSGVRWDSHSDNFLQHGYYRGLFDGLTTLADELKARDLWDTTLVAVISEMTRTPTFNSTKGKDHWPHTTCMLFGRNVVGGRVYGGTDDRIESLTIDPLTGAPDPSGRYNKYDNFAAGILASLDIDPGPWYPTIDPYLACFR